MTLLWEWLSHRLILGGGLASNDANEGKTLYTQISYINQQPSMTESPDCELHRIWEWLILEKPTIPPISNSKSPSARSTSSWGLSDRASGRVYVITAMIIDDSSWWIEIRVDGQSLNLAYARAYLYPTSKISHGGWQLRPARWSTMHI